MVVLAGAAQTASKTVVLGQKDGPNSIGDVEMCGSIGVLFGAKASAKEGESVQKYGQLLG
jgi:hypothetical protein